MRRGGAARPSTGRFAAHRYPTSLSSWPRISVSAPFWSTSRDARTSSCSLHRFGDDDHLTTDRCDRCRSAPVSARRAPHHEAPPPVHRPSTAVRQGYTQSASNCCSHAWEPGQCLPGKCPEPSGAYPHQFSSRKSRSVDSHRLDPPSRGRLHARFARNLLPLKHRGPHLRPEPARSSTAASLPLWCLRTPGVTSHGVFSSSKEQQCLSPHRPGASPALSPPP